jgi:hypothetical protein
MGRKWGRRWAGVGWGAERNPPPPRHEIDEAAGSILWPINGRCSRAVGAGAADKVVADVTSVADVVVFDVAVVVVVVVVFGVTAVVHSRL